MDILLVDDEVYTLRVLKNAVHWDACGIENVWTALSAARAREILEEHPVDLIICDIEMPKETGLDLLQWVREQHYSAEFILLTCHTDFSYAQQALKLGALDYCVKPVIVEEIEKVIKRAAESIEQKRRSQKAMEDQALWEKNKGVVNKAFWKETLEGRKGKSADEILKLAHDSNIFLEVDDLFNLAVFSIKFETLTEGESEFIRNVTGKLLHTGIVFESDDHKKWFWLVRNQEEEKFISDGRIYLDQIRRSEARTLRIAGLYCCNIYFEELSRAYKELCDGERMLTSYDQRFLNIRNRRFFETAQLELSEPLEKLLYAGDFKAFDLGFEKELLEKSRHSSVGVASLNMLRADICQILDVYLKSRNISAHTIFSNEEMCQAMNDATLSVEHMIAFVRKMAEIFPRKDNVTDITSAVKKYIFHHISEDISRNDIAKALYLNDDYISRVFKKDTGMTIPQYINKARIDRAKELLAVSDMAVGDVAEAVGYSNFSYFSKIFRQYENCTPREYKLRQK